MEIKGQLNLKNVKQQQTIKDKKLLAIKRLPPLPPKNYKMGKQELKEYETEKELKILNDENIRDYRNITNMFLDQQKWWNKVKQDKLKNQEVSSFLYSQATNSNDMRAHHIGFGQNGHGGGGSRYKDLESVRKAHYEIIKKKKSQNFGLTWVEKTIKKFEHDTSEGWLLRLAAQRKQAKFSTKTQNINDLYYECHRMSTPQNLEKRVQKRMFDEKIRSLDKDSQKINFLQDQTEIHKLTQKCDKLNEELQEVIKSKIIRYEKEHMHENIQNFWRKYKSDDVTTTINKFNL